MEDALVALNEKDIQVTVESESNPNESQALTTDSDLNTDDVGFSLDLSSLKEEESPAEEEVTADLEAAGESLYYKTLSAIENGEINLETGIMLLKKSASDGCALAWIYLGKMYSDANSAMTNPALAFDCFSGAADLDDVEGYYNLGRCYSEGYGCEKNEELALENFLKGANLGCDKCICALGICSEFGIGREADYRVAAALYAKAAESENAVAINNLAGCYFYGHGVEQDKEKAVSLFQKASELGNSGAECRLGICCETGDGCPIDLKSAFNHYSIAAQNGNPVAAYRLALCYDKGIGTGQNYAHAFIWYCKAAEAGNSQAMYEAGMMYKNGRGTKKDESSAYKMFSAAAASGFANAEHEVGNCYFEGIGTVRNRNLAFIKYTRAYEVDSGNSAAAFKLGLCHLKGLGTKKNAASAFEWFCRGDELGSPAATYMKGECYFYGVGVEENKEEAFKCYDKAVSYDYDYADTSRTVPATLALARCLELGLGTEQDHRRALELYKGASETGDAEAMYLTGCAIVAGVGMKAEYAAARIYFLRAARKGHVPAMLTMGTFADEGKGVQKNSGDAQRWYTKTVNSQIARAPELYEFPHRFEEALKTTVLAKTEAEYRLGKLLARTEPSAQSYVKAFEHIAIAASMDYEPAQTEIAKIYANGGDLKAYFEGPFSKIGAKFDNGESTPDDQTLGEALNKLGNALFDGTGMTAKNESAAARCYKMAAEIGNNDARYSYGWCLRHGVGVRENNAEAVKWLKLAADKGNSNAAYSYGLCCEEGSETGIKNRREALRYYRMAAAQGHPEAAQRYVKLADDEE